MTEALVALRKFPSSSIRKFYEKRRKMITKNSFKSSRCILVFLIIITTMLGAGSLLAEPRVSTDKNNYEPNEKILVHFSGAPGSNRDWICIAPAKAKDDTVGAYDYIPSGHSKGTLTLKAPAPGRYEVRAYYNYREKGYVVSARHEFVVSHEPSPTTASKPPKKKKSRPQRSSSAPHAPGDTFGPK
jgi:hypothetical protein